ncbi:MAG: Dna2/Cas4 domain-containing protein [Parabacteroides distasonis]|nr:Dna2/Cas4 domain-containing protein [Parabacteroides distasonis]
MLTIYRASAGAGKTHRLTGEFLILLFTTPGAFRRILAVTFTNKATEEMKKRVIDELYNLSSGKQSDYIDQLKKTYSLTELQVRNQATKILKEILHDYSAFNISTIDRFFQQTMRAFTREIGLQGGYGIEMDQDLVLMTAIDNLLFDLEKPENKDMLGWLLRFAEDKIENGEEWNLRKDIVVLSRELFKESYKIYSEKVSEDIKDKDVLESYKEDLYKIIRSVEREVQSLGEKGLAIMKKYGVSPTDFKGGSRSPLCLFEKWAHGDMKEPTSTFIGLVDKIENYYTKSTSESLQQMITSAVSDGLNDCVCGAISLFSDLKAYYSAREIVRYYYTLGILADVARQIMTYREDKNIMLIADTTELLNKVIAGSDTPFIYEKTGTHIDHYMIDEFQDTSGMQWDNFRPLIDESLACGRTNLIVGDVKQSIYRFRNSDWNLLDEQIHSDFSIEQFQEKTLKENWRSSRHIVTFNNSLFTILPIILQKVYKEALSVSCLSEKQQDTFLEKFITAYKQCTQRVAPPFLQKEGHVRLEFLLGEEEKSWKECVLERIPKVLEELLDNGYLLKDIAILVRTNREGAMIADYLLAYKANNPTNRYSYDIISDEALFVSGALSVRFLVSVLRYLKHPENRTNRQVMLQAYSVLKGTFGKEPQTIYSEELFLNLDSLSRQSLYEIIEGLFRFFSMDFPENEQIFLQAFFDMVSEFVQKESADLIHFLKWWDETGCRKTIATPDGQNAIRILTIHKSKGLGFKAVLIPFGDWEIDHKPTKQVILWCHPKEAPFNRLHLVPVRYNQSLSKTIFAADYFKERLQVFIDNLNTLYVAFTRSKEELIVFAPRPNKIKEGTGLPEKISSLADALWVGLCTAQSNMQEDDLITLPSFFDSSTGVFELGDWWKPVIKKEVQNIQELEMEQLNSISPDERLQLRLRGKGYFFDDTRRKYGSLMHEVLSGVRTSADISEAVGRYWQVGVIDKDESVTLINRLEELINMPEVAVWYDGTTRVLNEVDILVGKGLSKRPDRVMITNEKVIVVDYKFGEQLSPKHHCQVKNYLSLIRQMGYKQVEGYLWYVELNKIEAVKG